MVGGTQSGAVDDPFHMLFVSKRHSLIDAQSWGSERFAQPCGEDHRRLPQTLDSVDSQWTDFASHLVDDRRVVPQIGHVDVRVEYLADFVRQC